MITVGLRVLKNRLSEYVRRAAGGDIVLITDRERVVAEMGPPRSTRADLLPDAMLAEAVRKGLITPALDPDGPMPEQSPIAPLEEILQGLDSDRADR
jgi:antitoxin (DNA-binding transcriptional repressor) of toxin-antitoxin stability system